MKVLAISVVALTLAGTKRAGTSVYIASLIQALQEIAQTDICLLAHAHSGISEILDKSRLFELGPEPDLLARHFLSWHVGVKSSVWQYNSASLKSFLKKTKKQDYDVAVFLEENAAIYAKYLPARMPKILVRHNLDSQSLKIDYGSIKSFFASWTAKHLSRRFDLWTLRKFARTTIGTDREEKFLRRLDAKAGVCLLPTITRFDLGNASFNARPVEPSRFKAVFVGGFDYAPNREAIYWLIKCQDYLPAELLSALEVTLIGRSPPAIPGNCKIKFLPLGFVEDLDAVFSACDFAVIPIVSGSGVKIKSLTLLSSGLPVITTSEGVRGIDVRDGSECLIADDQKTFSEAIGKLYADPALRNVLRQNAHDFIRTHFSAQRQNETLLKIMEQAVNHPACHDQPSLSR